MSACPPALPPRPWSAAFDPSPHPAIWPPRDDDMQSLASLMSVKPSDVGNLDDFADSDEEEASVLGGSEARARAPQPGGLTACAGLRPLRPREVGGRCRSQSLCRGRGHLAHAQC